jgi:hypothetical protein
MGCHGPPSFEPCAFPRPVSRRMHLTLEKYSWGLSCYRVYAVVLEAGYSLYHCRLKGNGRGRHRHRSIITSGKAGGCPRDPVAWGLRSSDAYELSAHTDWVWEGFRPRDDKVSRTMHCEMSSARINTSTMHCEISGAGIGSRESYLPPWCIPFMVYEANLLSAKRSLSMGKFDLLLRAQPVPGGR